MPVVPNDPHADNYGEVAGGRRGGSKPPFETVTGPIDPTKTTGETQMDMAVSGGRRRRRTRRGKSGKKRKGNIRRVKTNRKQSRRRRH
jgi:hypothetical protein